MTLKNLFLLGATVLALHAVPALARQVEIDPAHRQALAEMLDATRLPDKTLASVHEAAAKPGAGQDFLQQLARRITRADVLKAHVDALAPLLSAADARQVSQAYASPQGKLLLAYEQEVARAGARASSLVKRSASQYRALAQFAESAPVRHYTAMSRQAAKAAEQALMASQTRYQQELFQRGVDAMDVHFAAFDMLGAAAPTPYVPAESGVPYVDQWLALLAETSLRRLASQWRYLADMKALGQDTMLKPQQLVNPEMVARNLAALDKIDAQTEGYLTERDLILSEYYARAVTIEAARRQKTEMQAEMAEQQRLYARLAKGKRAVLETTRRILGFAQSRKGRLQVDGSSLMLANDNDLKIYNAYVDQLDSNIEEVNMVVGRLNKRTTNWL